MLVDASINATEVRIKHTTLTLILHNSLVSRELKKWIPSAHVGWLMEAPITCRIQSQETPQACTADDSESSSHQRGLF